MKQLLTTGIILSRTDYGEADRIITLLTPDYGKLRLMAKGVRRIKSKLAGGIELFSVSNITFIQGRGDMGTLISTRLIKHYRHIVEDIDRTLLGYELTKQLNKTTEDEPESAYFELLEQAFAALDDASISTGLVRVWFTAQLLKQAGHSPNLTTDSEGNALSAERTYLFNFETMSYTPHVGKGFGTDGIKFMRLLFAGNTPAALQRVTGSDKLVELCAPQLKTQQQMYLR